MATKVVREQLEKFEASINASIVNINARISELEQKQLGQNVTIDPGITTSLDNIVQRLSLIEVTGSGNVEDKDEILKKIEEKGNEISNSNQIAAEGIKKDILEIRNVLIQNLTNSNRKLQAKTTLLETRMTDTEKKLNLLEQHGRKVNFEIDGISDDVEGKDLKHTAVQIFKLAGLNETTTKDIEVIHRLRSRKKPTNYDRESQNRFHR